MFFFPYQNKGHLGSRVGSRSFPLVNIWSNWTYVFLGHTKHHHRTVGEPLFLPAKKGL